jgi:hypothetical protein
MIENKKIEYKFNRLLEVRYSLINHISCYEKIYNYKGRNMDYLKRLLNDLENDIKKICKHNYLEDEIETFHGFTERIQKIVFCDKCWLTF